MEAIQLKEYFVNTFDNDITSKHDKEIQNKVLQTLCDVIKYLKLNNFNRIIYIGLYGSQNYQLDTENSDVDCQCFLLPDIHDIIFNNPINATTIPTTHGTCVIKDIRSAFSEVRKCSPNILEVFATKYSLCNKDYYFHMKQICNSADSFAMISKYKLLKGLEGLYYKYKNKSTNDIKYLKHTEHMINMLDIICDNDEYSYYNLLVPLNIDDIKKMTLNNLGSIKLHEQLIEKKLEKYFSSHEPTFVPERLRMLDNYQESLMKFYFRFIM